MPLDAHEEIESIAPEMKTLAEVLAVRVKIFRALGSWELMETVARQLCDLCPDDPDAFISPGFATRRAVGLRETLADLTTVAYRFLTCATILYNLTCYAVQLGHLDSARARLAEAIKMESVCREVALADPDLVELRAGLSA